MTQEFDKGTDKGSDKGPAEGATDYKQTTILELTG
jgi:hypothetical protein